MQEATERTPPFQKTSNFEIKSDMSNIFLFLVHTHIAILV